MKMPENRSTDNGLYNYDENSYFSDGIDNSGVEEFDAAPEDDFSEYLWMENEEEFDKEELQRLEEEALMEQCIAAMLDDEYNESSASHNSSGSNDLSNELLSISHLKIDCAEVLKASTLNPLAAEFVPGGSRSSSNNSSTTATNSSTTQDPVVANSS